MNEEGDDAPVNAPEESRRSGCAAAAAAAAGRSSDVEAGSVPLPIRDEARWKVRDVLNDHQNSRSRIR